MPATLTTESKHKKSYHYCAYPRSFTGRQAVVNAVAGMYALLPGAYLVSSVYAGSLDSSFFTDIIKTAVVRITNICARLPRLVPATHLAHSFLHADYRYWRLDGHHLV